MFIDENFNCHKKIECFSKLNSVIHTIRKLRKYLNLDVLETLDFANFQSEIRFRVIPGIVEWKMNYTLEIIFFNGQQPTYRFRIFLVLISRELAVTESTTTFFLNIVDNFWSQITNFQSNYIFKSCVCMGLLKGCCWLQNICRILEISNGRCKMVNEYC